jgi:hypothetical protein
MLKCARVKHNPSTQPSCGFRRNPYWEKKGKV